MANYVVFLDGEHAKIFELHPDNIVETKMNRHEQKSHLGHPKDHAHDSAKFFHEVAAKLKKANEILLIGPGLAKDHFNTHLQHHHHEEIARKVVGVQTVDHPTEGEIVALAKKFFKAHLQFV